MSSETRRRRPPAPPSPFVGRQTQLEDLLLLLGDARAGGNRVLSCTGLGGSGKTRLAAEAARSKSIQSRYSQFCWVDLTSLSGSADAVARDIGAALGLANHARGSLDALVDQMPQDPLLLVLDNCEPVIEAVAEAVEALVAAAPELTVLVTSRVPLNIDGEANIKLEPMSTSPAAGEAESEAAKLFRARAKAVAGDLVIGPADAGLVEDIVQKLDGFPLAIELAAARLRSITTLNELYRRLDQQDFLAARGSTVSTRQRTMRAVLQWSWDECGKAERELWAGLSVFAGHFTLEAAEAVGERLNLGEATVLDVLAELTDLGVVSLNRGRNTYQLLDTLASYGHEQLKYSGLERAARDAHLDFYVEQAEVAAVTWFAAAEVDLLQWWQRDLPNVRAALGHAEATGQVAAALRLVIALTRLRVCHWASALTELRGWLGRLLARPDAVELPRELRIVARCYETSIALLQGDTSGAALLEHLEAPEVRDALEGDDQLRAVVEFIHGTGYMIAGDGQLAATTFESALEHLPPEQSLAGDRHMMTLFWGICCASSADEELASRAGRIVYEDAVQHRAGGCATAWAVWPRAVAAIRHGCPDAAAEAVSDLRPSLRDLAAWGDGWGPTWMCLAIAWGLTAAGHPAHAAAVFGAADHLQRLVGCEVSKMGTLADCHTAHLQRCINALGRDAFDVAYRRGLELQGPSEVVELALRDPASAPGLTEREQEVAELVADGLTNRQIAEKLVIATRTAESHVWKILGKLGINDRMEIADHLRRRADHAPPRGY